VNDFGHSFEASSAWNSTRATVLAVVAVVLLAWPAWASTDFATPILVYHRFGPAATDEMTVRTSVFEAQLEALNRQGYTVIPLRVLVAHRRGVGPPPPRRAVVLTVDDGHRSVYTDMLPVLRRHGVPVTLFVYPSAVSNATYALTWEQLRELGATGLVDIQSHTYWHPNFLVEKRKLSAQAYQQLVEDQLRRSRAVLEEHLGTTVDLLSWPFGIHDDVLKQWAIRAGYVAAVALGRRHATTLDPIMALPRYLVTDGDQGARFEALLEGRAARGDALGGQVVDAVTGAPVVGASVTSDGDVVQTDAQGVFRVKPGELLRLRAPGYRRRDVPAAGLTPVIALEPFSPKALYLSVYGVGASALREPALRLIAETELNAVVIDVKGDRGLVPYRSAVPLAAQVGAQQVITIKDPTVLLAGLRQKGIYTIARIVVFKDDPLARGRPHLAVKDHAGHVWRDREQLAWTDPFLPEVRDYNLALAVEAARHGFDEIQFDYVRFPDATGLAFAQPSTQGSRVRAIEGFLAEARRRLAPYSVFIAADVFGYVCWNQGDTGIGQTLETLMAHLDYLSPMLYPSSFQFGIPGYRNPIAHPSEIVALSLARAAERTGLAPARFRPWVQAFPDYAFDRRPFRGAEIRAQIDAAERFGARGWMLWNPHNVYSREGLRLAPSSAFSSP
jgi:hypothetical protein